MKKSKQKIVFSKLVKLLIIVSTIFGLMLLYNTFVLENHLILQKVTNPRLKFKGVQTVMGLLSVIFGVLGFIITLKQNKINSRDLKKNKKTIIYSVLALSSGIVTYIAGITKGTLISVFHNDILMMNMSPEQFICTIITIISSLGSWCFGIKALKSLEHLASPHHQ